MCCVSQCISASYEVLSGWGMGDFAVVCTVGSRICETVQRWEVLACGQQRSRFALDSLTHTDMWCDSATLRAKIPIRFGRAIWAFDVSKSRFLSFGLFGGSKCHAARLVILPKLTQLPVLSTLPRKNMAPERGVQEAI